MNDALLALFMAAGVGALAYAKLGKRAGYGNQANVWTLVGVSFAVTFIVFLIIFKSFIHLNN